MELLLHQWEDWPELYRNTDKTEVTEIVIIDSQMNYRGKLDTYVDLLLFSFLFIIHGQMTGIYKAGDFAFRFLLNLFGAFSAFSILVQWSSRCKCGRMPIFKYLSHRTMIVYLLHQQVIYFFITWLNGAVPPIAHGVINFIGTMIITLALSEVVLGVKVLRYLTGN